MTFNYGIRSYNAVDYARKAGGASGQYALEFDGTNTYVNCGSSTDWDGLDDAAMTLEAYVRVDGSGTNSIPFLISTMDASHNWALGLYTDYGVGATIQCATTDAFGAGENGDIDLITGGIWYHVAMTWDDASYNYPRVWIDGTEVTHAANCITRSGAVSPDTTENLFLGDSRAHNRHFEGAMAWARVSNVVRYTAGFTPDAKDSPPAVDGNTVEQWNFNDGAGVTAAAEVNSANNGTITSGAGWTAL